MRLSRSWGVLQSISSSVSARFGSSPNHLQPFDSKPESMPPGSWRLPEAALAFSENSETAQTSLVNLPSPSEFPSFGRFVAPAGSEDPADPQNSPRELLGPFSTSSQAGPPTRDTTPLCSTYAVGPALAAYSLPDPAGLFHPAALLGFRGNPSMNPAPLSRRRTVDQSPALLSSPSPPRFSTETEKPDASLHTPPPEPGPKARRPGGELRSEARTCPEGPIPERFTHQKTI